MNSPKNNNSIKTKNALLPLVFVFSLFANCQSKRALKPIPLSPGKITIQSLTAINLSEDMSEVSTKEDEILLLTFVLKSHEHTSSILQEQSFEYTFTQRNEMAPINQTFSLDQNLENTKLVFLLTELDYENSASDVYDTLKQALKNGPLPDVLNDSILDKAIKYDDFLGWHMLALDQLSTDTPKLIKFTGLQMFDRFEYSLKLK